MNRVETLLRQQRLLLRSAQLRHALGDQAQALKTPLALADRFRDGAAWLRHNPLALAAALLVVVLLRPGRVLRWGASLWSGWRLWRKLRDWATETGLVEPSTGGAHRVRSR